MRCAQRHARGILTGSILARAIPVTCAGAFPSNDIGPGPGNLPDATCCYLTKQQEPAGARKKNSCQFILTVPLFNVARRPRPASSLRAIASKPVAPSNRRTPGGSAARRVKERTTEGSWGWYSTTFLAYLYGCVPMGSSLKRLGAVPLARLRVCGSALCGRRAKDDRLCRKKASHGSAG